MDDWTQLLTPVVVAAIPVIVMLAKRHIPYKYKLLYPVLATMLGPAIDLALAYLQSRASDPKWGVAMGLMAIGLRELWDQGRGPVKAMASHVTGHEAPVVLLALALAGLTGCVTGTDLQDSSALTSIIRADLTAAKANFDAAGMPTESACVQAVLERMERDAVMDMQVRGLISLGSAAYIRYAQLAGSQQRPIPDTCYAIIGKITTAVGKQGIKAVAPF